MTSASAPLLDDDTIAFGEEETRAANKDALTHPYVTLCHLLFRDIEMSWFDASSFASIAKTALKEAQKTIDKALDIKDDDLNLVPANTPVDTNSEDFFGLWGLTSTTLANKNTADAITKSPTKSSKSSTSIWGSFTGSFFDTAAEADKSKELLESLDDSIDINNDFKESKLVVQDNEESEVPQKLFDFNDSIIDQEISPKTNVGVSFDESTLLQSTDNVTVRKRDRNVISSNRLSIISSESDKRSSESVEVLSNTECTTSPDSDALSLGQSISTSSGMKPTSDSVEILLGSLTSPSSVEILESDSISSRRESQHTDEFISPLESPEDISRNAEKTSPDSVEVIPEHEENSIAEDTISYTSISESTAVTVLDSTPILHIIHQKNTKDVPLKNEDKTEGSNLEKNIEPITRPPSRSTLHLSLGQVNMISTQPQSVRQDISNLLKTSNIIDIPESEKLESLQESNDEGSQSDKTLIASDTFMDSSTDTSTTTDSNFNSTYLKTMLADAMVEKNSDLENLDDTDKGVENVCKDVDIVQRVSQIPPRETSPLSSESSNMVKIGSDQTSGHTSGDELETTTSSDIEIISSPNGDSSSTQSRHSPSKLSTTKHKTAKVICFVGETNVDVLLGKMTFKKLKGHNRELSEASSISDDSEIDRLVKRITEVTEILESREAKLIEISRKYIELQEANNDLKQQLTVINDKQIDSPDLSQVTEEYTQRLSALERKFQQAIRDKDSLKKQLDQCKQEATLKLNKSEMDSMVLEKDGLIKELREEGEKLSKQQLQHSNIIKKLRTKEKEHENTIKYLKDNVEGLTSETERLKRSLTAKEDVERSQIEAVHQLTAKNKKLENEVNQLKGNVDDLTQKHETVKKSLDAAKRELVDKNKTSSELLAREQLLQNLENQKRMTESQNEEVINQLEDLRLKLRDTEQQHSRKEQSLRMENNELLRRLEDAERRSEELAQATMEVNKPLIRQLESLQATYNKKVTHFEQIEQGMQSKISEFMTIMSCMSLLKLNVSDDIQSRLQTLTDLERTAREDCITLKSKLVNVETQLSDAMREKDQLRLQIDRLQTEHMLKEQDLRSQIDNLQQTLKAEQESNEEKKKEITSLQHKLSIEKVTSEAEKRRVLALQEQVQDKSELLSNAGQSTNTPGDSSPTLSLGRVSLSESLSSSLWLPDEAFDTSVPGKCTNLLEMQYIQSNLKQREGEVQQLMWELNRREHERTILNSEISNLLAKVENLESKTAANERLQSQFNELQQQYDTLCQLYGEKVEETEELKLDLLDVKEMYKSQIDELLKQSKNC
ncbi:tata element modulatory factor tmf1 [Holotrichia oblita]|uniref:Tata element modulatory factor tmf1 n=1 Tax=Holotrichia oblita TaxID=644536 RepID=A0ACB9TWV1_HOLOL|nr:tata element modulatory factor tmf1 [Holotrichia oblita]